MNFNRLSGRPLRWAALVGAGLVGGYLLAALVVGGDDRQHAHEDAGMDTSRAGPQTPDTGLMATQLYTCSMHPQVRSTNPDDRCPICGMALIPVPVDGDDARDEGEAPQLRLSPRAAALLQIEVLPVARRTVEVPVHLFGRLDYDETRLRTIAAWMAGRLDKMHVNFTGEAVRHGQPLVEIYSPALVAAQEELLQAIRASSELDADGVGVVRETTRLTVQASRDRLRLLGLGPKQIEALEQRGQVQDHVTISAPLGGVVIERLAAVGDYVEAGTPIFRLADLSRLWAQLEVYEADLQRLAIGQNARFTAGSHPGEQFSGTVTFIDPTVSNLTRTARVRVDLANADGRLKPGMFVRGEVSTTSRSLPEAEAPLLIPASAPLITGRRAVVYVQLRDTAQPTFEPRDVVLGPRADGEFVVQEGLSEGELVVVNGAFKIDSELQIRGRASMMQPAGGAPPGHDHGPGQSEPGAPASFRIELGRLVRAQFALVRALAGDDPAAARDAALAVDEALHAIDGAALEGMAARSAWNEAAGTMHRGLSALAASAGLDGQREHFESFSDTLTGAVQAFGIEDAGPVYRAMCPMVQGREGHWLQDEEVIANPYYGAAMLRCGEIVDTLADDDAHTGHTP